MSKKISDLIHKSTYRRNTLVNYGRNLITSIKLCHDKSSRLDILRSWNLLRIQFHLISLLALLIWTPWEKTKRYNISGIFHMSIYKRLSPVNYARNLITLVQLCQDIKKALGHLNKLEPIQYNITFCTWSSYHQNFSFVNCTV